MSWFAGIIFVEHFIAAVMYCYRYPRRRYFALILVACVVCGATISMALPQIDNIFYHIAQYLLYFLVICGIMWALFKINFWQALFGGAAGYATQHFVNNFVMLLGVWWSFGDVTDNHILSNFLELVCFYIPWYVIAFFLFARNIEITEYDSKYNWPMKFLSLAVLFICIIISRFVKDFGRDKAAAISESLYGMVCCALCLVLQFSVYKIQGMQRENAVVNQLWYEDKKRFEAEKRNVELINVKCHDIRRYIRSYGNKLTEKELKELADAVQIYDSRIAVGNEVLGVLLSEISLACTRNKITLTCMGDGGMLDFLSAADIFSLFGNALDNAVAAVEKLPEEKRQISMILKKAGDLVSINITNYFDGGIKFEDGIPLTTKSDEPGYHGYGVKSIRMVAQKYNGDVSITTEGELFELNIRLDFSSKTE